MNGTVKWFDTRKGYGFIVGDDGQDYFVHYSQIQADGYKTLHTDESINANVRSTDGSSFSTSVRGTPFFRACTS